jgi:plastocyanin
MKTMYIKRKVRSRKNHYMLYIVSLFLFILFPACNNDAPNPPSPSSPQTNTQSVSTKEITMQNTTFNPAEITVSKGTTVRWINQDAIPHTATSDQGFFDSRNMNPNDVFEYTFDSIGVFPYHCTYHTPVMVGKITVQ